jgi:uracil-DNA glycosylase
MKVVMPLKEKTLYLTVLMESELEEVDWVKIRYEQQNLKSKKRLVAIYHHSSINKEWL